MASPTYDEFIAEFPEFSSPDNRSLVEAKIAEATAMLDESAFGEALYNGAVGYKAAHLIAMSPFGRQAQLVNDDGSTVYGRLFEEEYLSKINRRGILV